MFNVQLVNKTRRTNRWLSCWCRTLLARQRHLTQTFICLDTLKGSTMTHTLRTRWRRGQLVWPMSWVSIFFNYYLRPARCSKCQHSKQTDFRSRAYSCRGVANYLCVPDDDLCERNSASIGRTGNRTSNLQQGGVDALQQVTVHSVDVLLIVRFIRLIWYQRVA